MPITPQNNEQIPVINQYETEFKESQIQNNEIGNQVPIITGENAPVESESTIKGLSQEEMNDPNKIEVTIADGTAPLIVLFGPPACGKTMTLVRMTRYLKSEGYTVSPIRSFRSAADKNYTEICDNFNEMINSNDAAVQTSRISFMLVEVIKNGRRLCQILEAPGEYYFNPKFPNAQFPNYVNRIIASSNRKVWTIMVEPDWCDQSDRANYVTKITQLKNNGMRTSDSVVFLYNKIDVTPYVYGIGKVHIKAAIKDTKNLYPNIFVPFKNVNPLTKYISEYNCDFVPFQTGTYTTAMDNSVTYQEGPVEYCKQLWKVLSSKI